ncbi:MAG TPA: glutamine--tRNA ligase/YqeY domain fusion protein [Dokdonella sp.]|uniref:glutamine--tRNA ligase/YqeY domain fusion protein n=1 Tax=Dokdonella sp. TaxID=2291710 RepID=UPI0025C24065|nr:glutamine--tRNA ligase/YqeY domain fusion protein [Dokdonella sp.]MBX3692871.1 glutamine--tRNA ligase/YqeY domain fusion protein [Dokdonella sp.]MCW5566652.1 glutamine--tRNA ligase/YqeY domain fusion protein [Dokdonella sp.]HNR91935.1 glutamine--tRNA ligase/YqeY domain fusion protein [Dokdonella sp.]
MNETSVANNFIRQIVVDDNASGKHGGRVATRFPPEPNGYLHLGHGKSIGLNFGIARDFGGTCNLRFDDTNPAREDVEYVEAIKDDVRWLGFDWAELRHASDYFEVFYRCALKLIETGKAYVCDLSAEEVREYRGTLTEPGRDSPFRERSISDNLDLFRRMRAGEFADGTRTLRAKIDMAAGNINMRDPAIYRIRKLSHQNTGDTWPIYPMYDYAHCVSDALEGITHSLCTLEFEDHRPLYDWFLDQLDLPNDRALSEPLREAGFSCEPARPRQIEFARGNLDYTVMSKRKLMALVQDGLVDGWDDPRMPTLSGVRRRGFPPAAVRTFWERAGVTKQNSVIEYGVLEGCVREVLDAEAPRRLGVIDPLKLVLVNLPEEYAEVLRFPNHPKNDGFGDREVPFSRELWIEREDFMEEPVKGFHRLVPGGEVRLRGVGIVRCVDVVKSADGAITELHGTLDADTRPGRSGAERKVKGTIHWVSAPHAIAAEVRLYDRLFDVADPDDDSDGKTYRDHLNPNSRRIVRAWLEPALASVSPESTWQFERLGYFVADRHDCHANALVFNRVVTLRDTWARTAGR